MTLLPNRGISTLAFHSMSNILSLLVSLSMPVLMRREEAARRKLLYGLYLHLESRAPSCGATKLSHHMIWCRASASPTAYKELFAALYLWYQSRSQQLYHPKTGDNHGHVNCHHNRLPLMITAAQALQLRYCTRECPQHPPQFYMVLPTHDLVCC